VRDQDKKSKELKWKSEKALRQGKGVQKEDSKEETTEKTKTGEQKRGRIGTPPAVSRRRGPEETDKTKEEGGKNRKKKKRDPALRTTIFLDSALMTRRGEKEKKNKDKDKKGTESVLTTH